MAALLIELFSSLRWHGIWAILRHCHIPLSGDIKTEDDEHQYSKKAVLEIAGQVRRVKLLNEPMVAIHSRGG